MIESYSEMVKRCFIVSLRKQKSIDCSKQSSKYKVLYLNRQDKSDI